MCTLFHTCNEIYNVDDTFSIDMFDGAVTHHHESLDAHEQGTNRFLNQFRPDGAPSRLKCIYLFANLQQCRKYALSCHKQYIYEVRSENPFGPYPMTLVDALNKKENAAIANEYWNPIHPWKVMEFLASSFVVVSEIAIGGRFNDCTDFANDIVLRNRLFP